MLILAFESSAKSASVALCLDGTLIAQYHQCCGLTHSSTLLPMAADLLKNTAYSIDQMDLLAVAHGPGSFTGVRIGVSCVKGLAWGAEKPVVGVSTLEALAWQGVNAPKGIIICPVMDARRAQVYNALFDTDNDRPIRLCNDRAVSLEDLANELKQQKKPVLLVGDGIDLAYECFIKAEITAVKAPVLMQWQSAWGVAMAAEDKIPVSANDLMPVYLRLSQAERERQAKS